MAFDDPMQGLSFEDRKPILERLEPGEIILWADRPKLTASFKQASVGLCFGIGWIVLVCYLYLLRPDGLPWFLAVPFILIGVLVIVKSLGKIKFAKRTLYALSDRRAFISTPTRLQSYRITPSLTYRLKETGDGSGDILFDRWEEEHSHPKPDTADHPKGVSRRMNKTGFTDLEQVRTPFTILNELTVS